MRRVVASVLTSALGFVVLLGGLPATASPGMASFPPVRPTRVLVLGDSVAKGAVGAIPGRLPGREVIVDAEVNRSTGQAADRIGALGTGWDVVVVLIAHNDGGSAGVYQPAARRIVDQLRDVPRISFLTLHEVRPEYAGVNAFWRTLEAEHPNVTVGDWGSVAAANPGALAGDGLHLNGSGASLLADVVGQQVEAAEADWTAAMQAFAAAATTTTTAPPTTTTTAPPTTTTAAPTTTTTAPPTTTQPTTTQPEPPQSAIDADADATSAAATAGATSGPGPLGGVALTTAVVAGGALIARRQRLARSH